MPILEPWPPQAKLVNPDGTGTQAWQNYTQRLSAILKGFDTQVAATVVQQATAQASANAAAETAAAAYEDTTAATTQERTADFSFTVGSAWVEGPMVTFEAAVGVAHVTSEDSGPLYFSQFKVPLLNGEVRLVQIIGATETVLATEPFEAFIEDQSISFGAIGYDAASAATGAISYRVDARTLGGTIYGLGLRTHIKRAP